MTPELVTETVLDTVEEWFPRYPWPLAGRATVTARSNESVTLAVNEAQWPYGTHYFRVSLRVEQVEEETP